LQLNYSTVAGKLIYR